MHKSEVFPRQTPENIDFLLLSEVMEPPMVRTTGRTRTEVIVDTVKRQRTMSAAQKAGFYTRLRAAMQDPSWHDVEPV